MASILGHNHLGGKTDLLNGWMCCAVPPRKCISGCNDLAFELSADTPGVREQSSSIWVYCIQISPF